MSVTGAGGSVNVRPKPVVKWIRQPINLNRETAKTFAVSSCAARDKPMGCYNLPEFTILRRLDTPRSFTTQHLLGLAERIENLVYARIQSDPGLKHWICHTSIRQGLSENTHGPLIFPAVRVDTLSTPLERIIDAQPGAPILLLILHAPVGGVEFTSPGYSTSGIMLYAGDAVLMGPLQDEELQWDPEALVARYYVPVFEHFGPTSTFTFTVNRPNHRAAPRDTLTPAGPSSQLGPEPLSYQSRM